MTQNAGERIAVPKQEEAELNKENKWVLVKLAVCLSTEWEEACNSTGRFDILEQNVKKPNQNKNKKNHKQTKKPKADGKEQADKIQEKKMRGTEEQKENGADKK